MRKTEPAHKKAYAEAFEKEKKRLFAGLAALHHYYIQFSEFFSHSTVAALSLRTSIESTDEFVKATFNYVETNPDHLLKALRTPESASTVARANIGHCAVHSGSAL